MLIKRCDSHELSFWLLSHLANKYVKLLSCCNVSKPSHFPFFELFLLMMLHTDWILEFLSTCMSKKCDWMSTICIVSQKLAISSYTESSTKCRGDQDKRSQASEFPLTLKTCASAVSYTHLNKQLSTRQTINYPYQQKSLLQTPWYETSTIFLLF